MNIRRLPLIAFSAFATSALLTACATPADDTAAPTAPATSAATGVEDAESTTQTTTPSTTVEASTGQQQGLSPLGSPDLSDKQSTPATGTNLIPKGVRVADHGSFTRVVLDFEGPGKAGWFTQMTAEPVQQASGHPIEYEGATAINIGVESTPWPSTPELEEAYMDFGKTTGTGIVTAVDFVTTFEAQSQFVIGLDKEAAYSVTFLEGPPRVVIDIMN